VTEGADDPAIASLDAALERALAAPELAGVYLSPWWPLVPVQGDEPVAGWKRSVLQRVPGRGAVHWGHLFLLVGAGARLGRSRTAGYGADSSESAPIEVPLPRTLAGSRNLWMQPRLRGPCELFAARLGAELTKMFPETS
jgi:hypothetical protein